MEVVDLVDGSLLVAKNDLGPAGQLLDIAIGTVGLGVQMRFSVKEAKALYQAIAKELPEVTE